MMTTLLLVNLFSIYLTFSFAVALIEVPLVRLFEQAICDRFFSARYVPMGSIDERECKIPEVQGILSNIVGWQMFCGALPGKPVPTLLRCNN